MLSYLDRTYSIQLVFDAFDLRPPVRNSLLVEQVRDFDSAQSNHTAWKVGNVKESLSS